MSLPSTSAAVCYGPSDLRIEERALWPPAPGEATVLVTHTTLCGSDLHYFAHGRNGDFALQAPLVLGHEASGVITALGPPLPRSASSTNMHAASSGAGAQTRLKVGMRVAVECGMYCGECNLCLKGRYNLCKQMRFCSSAKTFPHLDGTLQTKMNHPAHLLHPLPDNVTLEQAALAEPLSVLIHASRRTGLSPSPDSVHSPSSSSTSLSRSGNADKSVLVFGCGAIGLLACALAKARGVRRVVALDINERRLAFARECGWADDVFCLPPPSSQSREKEQANPKQVADERLRRSKASIEEALKHFGQPDGFDVVYECSGAEACIQMSVYACAPGGKVMLIGMGSPTVTLPLGAAATREVDLLGSFRYAATYAEALSLLSGSGKNGEEQRLDGVERLVTHRYKLADTRRAFEVMQKGQDERGNVVIKVLVEA